MEFIRYFVKKFFVQFISITAFSTFSLFIIFLPTLTIGKTTDNNNNLAEGDYSIDAKTSVAIPNYIGEVLLIKGRVTKGTQEELQKQGKGGSLISEGQKLYVNEVIRTSKKSIAKIIMVDESIITIAENSIFALNNFEFKSKNDRKSVYELLRGQFRAFFKNKNKNPDEIKVLLGVTSMGIRGTTLVGNIYSNEKEDDINQVAVVSGEIDLLNKNSNNTHNLKEGMHFVGMANSKNLKVNESVVKLSDEELKKLSISAEEEKNSEGPFLELYKIVANNDKQADSSHAADEKISRSVASDLNNNQVNEDDENSFDKKIANEKNSDWKKTLKTLNRTLNENNRNNKK
ncbi:MAG: FecR domain-containing protein [Oligoflexia bacterium]|nr:FecR domain-containing protein [Oligoflexia bacterium]